MGLYVNKNTKINAFLLIYSGCFQQARSFSLPRYYSIILILKNGAQLKLSILKNN